MYVKELGLKVQYGVDIGTIRASESESPRGRGYILTDQHGLDYTCRYCVISIHISNIKGWKYGTILHCILLKR